MGFCSNHKWENNANLDVARHDTGMVLDGKGTEVGPARDSTQF